MNKQTFTAVFMSLAFVSGAAFAQGTQGSTQGSTQVSTQGSVAEAKSKLASDVKAGMPKEQIKQDRMALKEARIAKRKAKIEVLKEKNAKAQAKIETGK